MDAQELPAFIAEALNEPPDFSPAFTAEVANLRSAVAAELGLPVAHDADMNYRSGQILSIQSDPANIAGGAKVVVLLSSRSQLFAVVVRVNRGTTPQGPWDLNLNPSTAPEQVHKISDVVRSVLREKGWVEVDNVFFNVSAPNAVTQMDGVPANVLETLFAEII